MVTVPNFQPPCSDVRTIDIVYRIVSYRIVCAAVLDCLQRLSITTRRIVGLFV